MDRGKTVGKLLQDQDSDSDSESDCLDFFGFLPPLETTIPTLWNKDITEGSEHTCVISVMYSCNELYLVLKKDFPENVDAFIAHSGRVFDKKIPCTPRAQLTVLPEELTPGAIVCVKDDEKDEFQRGKIVKTQQVFEEYVSRTYSRIITLDLGEYHFVDIHHVFYLPKELATQPAFAVKAKLQLDQFYDKRRNNIYWDKEICRKVLSRVFDKPIQVKFIRKIEEDDELTWEVSLLRFTDADLCSNDPRPIEQQLIAKKDGKYVITPVKAPVYFGRGRGRGLLIRDAAEGNSVAGRGRGRAPIGNRTSSDDSDGYDNYDDDYCCRKGPAPDYYSF